MLSTTHVLMIKDDCKPTYVRLHIDMLGQDSFNEVARAQPISPRGHAHKRDTPIWPYRLSESQEPRGMFELGHAVDQIEMGQGHLEPPIMHPSSMTRGEGIILSYLHTP